MLLFLYIFEGRARTTNILHQHPYGPNHHVLELRLWSRRPWSQGYLFLFPQTSLRTLLQPAVDETADEHGRPIHINTRDYDDGQDNSQDLSSTISGILEGDDKDTPSDIHKSEIALGHRTTSKFGWAQSQHYGTAFGGRHNSL